MRMLTIEKPRQGSIGTILGGKTAPQSIIQTQKGHLAGVWAPPMTRSHDEMLLPCQFGLTLKKEGRHAPRANLRTCLSLQVPSLQTHLQVSGFQCISAKSCSLVCTYKSSDQYAHPMLCPEKAWDQHAGHRVV